MRDEYDVSPDEKTIADENWRTLYNKLKTRTLSLSGVSCQETFWQKRPYIQINTWKCCDKYYEGDFSKFWAAEWFAETSMSLAQIMERFPAEQTIRYLKERGLTVCPML